MHCTKISAKFEFGGHRPRGAYPQKMWSWAMTLRKSAQAELSSMTGQYTVNKKTCHSIVVHNHKILTFSESARNLQQSCDISYHILNLFLQYFTKFKCSYILSFRLRSGSQTSYIESCVFLLKLINEKLNCLQHVIRTTAGKSRN